MKVYPDEVKQFVIAHYPTMPNKVISEFTGISIGYLYKIANQNGLRKTREYRSARAQKLRLNDEQRAKLSASLRRTYKMERARITMGLPQLTKRRIFVGGQNIALHSYTKCLLRAGHIRTGRRSFCRVAPKEKTVFTARERYKITVIDMNKMAPIITYSGSDEDGNEYEGQLTKSDGQLFLIYSDGGDIACSEPIVPETLKHVRTEYERMKYPLND